MTGQLLVGQMMDRPLLISGLIEHAEQTHPNTEIVSRRCEGDIHRYTMKDAAKRSRQVANLLQRLNAVIVQRVSNGANQIQPCIIAFHHHIHQGYGKRCRIGLC